MRISNGDGIFVGGLYAINIVNTGASHKLRIAVHEVQILFYGLRVKGNSVMERDTLAKFQSHYCPFFIEGVGFGQISLDLSILIFQKGFVKHGAHGVIINTHIKRRQSGCLGHSRNSKGFCSILASRCRVWRIAIGRPAAGTQHHAEAEHRWKQRNQFLFHGWYSFLWILYGFSTNSFSHEYPVV